MNPGNWLLQLGRMPLLYFLDCNFQRRYGDSHVFQFSFGTLSQKGRRLGLRPRKLGSSIFTYNHWLGLGILPIHFTTQSHSDCFLCCTSQVHGALAYESNVPFQPQYFNFLDHSHPKTKYPRSNFPCEHDLSVTHVIWYIGRIPKVSWSHPPSACLCDST